MLNDTQGNEFVALTLDAVAKARAPSASALTMLRSLLLEEIPGSAAATAYKSSADLLVAEQSVYDNVASIIVGRSSQEVLIGDLDVAAFRKNIEFPKQLVGAHLTLISSLMLADMHVDAIWQAVRREGRLDASNEQLYAEFTRRKVSLQTIFDRLTNATEYLAQIWQLTLH